MSYEVLFSDTAREDFNRLAGDSPKRIRIQALLERIAAGGADDDHVLSAPKSSLELRYLSLETTYVFFRRDPVQGQATVVYFCEMHVQPATAPIFPHRLIESQTSEIPHGQEVEHAVEFTRADGSRSLLRQFVRKIDVGDSYVVFHHVASGTSPTVTMIFSGRKGHIEGDIRHDEIELVAVQPDGSVRRFPAFQTPVWIKNPFEGVPADQMMGRMAEWMKTPEWQARREAVREWLQLGGRQH